MTWNVESLFDADDDDEDGDRRRTWRCGAHGRTDRVPHPSHDLIEWT